VDESYTSLLGNSQRTVEHALGFSVCTRRLLATDLNTETSTSDHYEVQPLWNLGTQLKTPLNS
jgi:hypothetical protein